jgi:hypothetical protein
MVDIHRYFILCSFHIDHARCIWLEQIPITPFRFDNISFIDAVIFAGAQKLPVFIGFDHWVPGILCTLSLIMCGPCTVL